jgi:hypothetical protein
LFRWGELGLRQSGRRSLRQSWGTGGEGNTVIGLRKEPEVEALVQRRFGCIDEAGRQMSHSVVEN